LLIEHLGHALKRAARADSIVGAFFIDVDNFKQINDCCGHPAGDAVLVRVAQICKAALRQQDLIGRTGGEEFLVICPESLPDAAWQIAERLRQAIEATRFDDICQDLRVTLSVGVAQFHDRQDSLDAMIERADSALYRAKSGGRNRVEAARAPELAGVPA
jgi:diguanylate cyclase (GGDEF)-like protein